MLLQAFTKIGDASRLLLEKGFTPEAVTEALGLVGEAIHVDRVYIFETITLENGRPGAAQRYEWVAGSTEPQLDNPALQAVPFDEVMPDWWEAFSKGEAVCGKTAERPSPSREILEAQDVQSLLVCPITLDGKLWGFVGFDDCHSARDWPTTEISLLKTLARALGGSLRHTQMRSTLRDARENLVKVLESVDSATGRG